MTEDKIKNIVKKAIFKIKSKFIDHNLIDKFHKLYYNLGIYQFTEWEGIKIYKYPSDMMLYSEIIFKNKPDLIIETGTLYGGSALYFARLLDILGYGSVISIDNKKRKFPEHKRITYITGDSIDYVIINFLKNLCKRFKRIMIILDSDHHKAHVLKEMNLYGELVSKGQYMVVEDGDTHLVYPSFGEGPYEAIQDFLKFDNRFRVDTQIENKFLFTANPKGWLKRIK